MLSVCAPLSQAQNRADETLESAKNTVSENVGAAQHRAGVCCAVLCSAASCVATGVTAAAPFRVMMLLNHTYARVTGRCALAAGWWQPLA